MPGGHEVVPDHKKRRDYLQMQECLTAGSLIANQAGYNLFDRRIYIHINDEYVYVSGAAVNAFPMSV